MNISNTVRLEDVACPLGCANNDYIIITGNDIINDLPGEFTLVKCRTCGLMRTNPRPTQETIGLYYPDNYGPFLSTRVLQTRSRRASIIKKLLNPVIKGIFDFKTETLPPVLPGRLLEIGCASGSFLHRMASKGWLVEGIEFSAHAAQEAIHLGYSVHVGPMETAPEPGESFDLIVGWMVLEHLHDPIGSLIKLHKWAKQGAYLVLSVPNADSLEFRIFKEKWYALQLPTHLHHFAPETLAKILKASGWSLEMVHHQRVLSNLIVSIGFVLRNKGYTKLGQKLIDFPKHSRKWPYILYPLAWIFSVFGQTGRMTIWARKVE